MNDKKLAEELVITRFFDASRRAVWEAWTVPEQMMKWWGPEGFTAPVMKIDFRIGGRYLYCMRSPEGKDTWGTGVYREIVEFERIVYSDSFADEKGNVVPGTYYGMGEDFPLELEVEVSFYDINGKTKMTLRHRGIPNPKIMREMEEGWEQSFDKLAQSLK